MNEAFKHEIVGRFFAFDSDTTGNRYEYIVAKIVDIDMVGDTPFAVVETGNIRRVVTFVHWKNTDLHPSPDAAAAEAQRLNRENNEETEDSANAAKEVA